MNLENQLEALLFWRAEPMSIQQLAEALERDQEEIRVGLKTLETQLADRGVRLVFKDDAVTLGTCPEASALIEKLTKEELSRELSKAALETLSIVLYQGPVTKSEIDYIRGVNSSFILRHLLVRGLIERIPNPKDARSFLYRPTFDLLSFLGISKIQELPEYQTLVEKINTFVNQTERREQQ